MRFLKLVDRQTGNDVFVTRADLRGWLARFDANGNRRIDTAGGDYRRLYRAVGHRRPRVALSCRAFERRFYG